MAIATATLTVTVSEDITLNGSSQGSSNVLTVTGVNDIYKRIITIPTSEITLYTTHATTVEGSIFDKDLVRYVRITNKDAANFVSVRLKDGVGAGDEFIYKLKAGESFLLYSHAGSMSAALGATAGAANGDIVSIKVQADTDPCDCEIFIASV